MVRRRRCTLVVGLTAVALLLLLVAVPEIIGSSVDEGGGGALPPHDPPVPLFPFDAVRDTLVLNPGEMQSVRRIHEREVTFVDGNESSSRFACPNRYIFVNTHTYGRHHNQLQEMMNIIVWAQRLNRTAVLGWFRTHSRWIHHAELYDFSHVMRRYCVVTAEAMQQRLSRTGRLGAATLACYGQCAGDTPLRSFARRLRASPAVVRVPAYFPWTQHEAVMRRVAPLLQASRADVVVIGGAYGLFLRRGLVELAALYSLLRPSPLVGGKVAAFLDHSFAPRDRFFGVHQRHRETMCVEEMDVMLRELQQQRHNVGEERGRLMRSQCNISVAYLAALHTSLGLELFSFPLFVAHDGQDAVTVRLLTSRGARVYDKAHYGGFEDCVYGLCALAVDFFVLQKGIYFTGNALSSVSQNTCFARLGSGLACHGMEPALLRLVSRDVLGGGDGQRASAIAYAL